MTGRGASAAPSSLRQSRVGGVAAAVAVHGLAGLIGLIGLIGLGLIRPGCGPPS